MGSPLSHAAAVAGEPGIPAVVGCGNATTRSGPVTASAWTAGAAW
ncbi:PEP-utilizing enzyme [Actinosynnema sp. NPDC053489]